MSGLLEIKGGKDRKRGRKEWREGDGKRERRRERIILIIKMTEKIFWDCRNVQTHI